MSDRYFLYATLGGERIEREVTLEEFIRAERSAGFRPKMASNDPRYWTTPATGSFHSGGSGGRVVYSQDPS